MHDAILGKVGVDVAIERGQARLKGVIVEDLAAACARDAAGAPAADGRYTVTLMATDPAGNRSEPRTVLVDVYAALAERAAQQRYVAPQVDDGDVIRIVAGRHPVIERNARGELRRGTRSAAQMVPMATPAYMIGAPA